MDREKQILKKFYEDVGEKYPEEEIVYQTLRGILRKKFVLSYLDRFKGSLLDVGCNRGMYLELYQGGARYGVDLSYQVLKKAHQNVKQFLAVADAERLQCFKPKSFDNVLCSEVLEHCLNPDAVFAGIYHVLKFDGYGLITTPNYKRHRPKWIGLGRLPRFGIGCDGEEGYFHTAYHAEELKKMAEKAGLKIIEFGTLEKNVKYAGKIPAALFIFGRSLNRLIKSRKFEQLNLWLFDKLMLWIYHACHFTGLDKMLRKFVKEGVRSYILVQK